MEPQKLYFLIGIAGSGKTTKAKELIAGDPFKRTYRVNKDTIRTLFTGVPKGSNNGGYDKDFEALVRDTERDIATSLLKQGYNVVVDDTNLSQKHFNFFDTLCSQLGVSMIVVDMTDVPLETCLRQNEQREAAEQVPDHVVHQMHMQVAQLDPVKTRNEPVTLDKKYVVCDIDGTIADATHRLHYVQNVNNDPDWKKNWQKFFAECYKDRLRLDVSKILGEYREMGYPTIFVSARPEYLREVTENWLDSFGLEYEGLLMRENKDSRQDDIVKQEILDKYLNKDLIRCWIDDRPKVIRQIQSNGIKVINVGLGEDF